MPEKRLPKWPKRSTPGSREMATREANINSTFFLILVMSIPENFMTPTWARKRPITAQMEVEAPIEMAP